jgi:integrase
MPARSVADVHGSGSGWCIQYRDESGRRRHKHLTRKADAEAVLDLAKRNRQRVRGGLRVETAPLTYGEYCERYLAGYVARPSTVASFRQRLKYSQEAFGKTVLTELRSDAVRGWVASLPVAPRTAGDALRAMRQVLARAVLDRYLEENPARKEVTKVPRAVVSSINPFRSVEEIEKVAQQVGPRDRELIRFACATGLRPQEWQALTWRDVDLQERTVTVRRTVSGGEIMEAGKTKGSLRTVYLSKRALDALERLRAMYEAANGDELVFPGREEGRPLNLVAWRRDVWKPALERAGVAHRPLRQMRHTFATLALDKGVPVEWIAEMMGHGDIHTTLNSYSRWLPRSHKLALKLLDAEE